MASSSSSSSFIFFFIIFFFIFLFSLSSAVPREAILDAVDILTDSGFISMSLTLEVVADSNLLQSPSLTIFAPSDSAFRKSGQPSLDLLRFHFIPMPLPAHSLRSLPCGAKIPTMFDGNSLIVTTPPSDPRISLNNVRINDSPIYDDGFLLIYGIERFFDPNFQYRKPIQESNRNPVCGLNMNMNTHTVRSSSSLNHAVKSLKSRGYSVMASFLGMQLSSTTNETPITVFAPTDDVAANHLGNFSDYPSFFLRHVVPCKLLWNELVSFKDGLDLPTYLDGFSINITRSNGVLMLNGVQVFFPDLYYSDELVVHGVNDVLNSTHENSQDVEESFSDLEAKPDEEEAVFSPGEL